MGGIFLLISGNSIKKLSLEPLMRILHEASLKDSKIIVKAQEEYLSHHADSKPAEEQKLPSLPTTDYAKIKLADVKNAFALRGSSSVSGIILSAGENEEFSKATPIDTFDSPKSLSEMLPPGYQNNIIACGTTIIGAGTPCILLFDGHIYDVKPPLVLTAEAAKKAMTDFADFISAKTPAALHSLLAKSSAAFHSLKKDVAKQYMDSVRDLLLTVIDGDFAFVYIDLLNNFILFGKDRFGKKSLLIHDQSSPLGQLCLSSISLGTAESKELVGNTLMSITLPSKEVPEIIFSMSPSPYPASASRFLPSPLITDHEQVLAGLEKVLNQAVGKRTNPAGHGTKARVAVLFSGGIDSLLMAYLVDRILPVDDEIDLINLAFEELAADRVTSLIGFHELKKINKDRIFNYIAIDVSPETLKEKKALIEKLIFPQATVMDLSIGTALFFGLEARGRTFADVSSVWTALSVISQEFPKIYTENKGGKQGEIALAAAKNPLFMEAYSSIKKSLSVAYQSTAVTVLNGLGADEIFGGYSRYYTYVKSGQLEELKGEFALDLDRLWLRNFGRDDRCTGCHSRVCVFPYLDVEVIEFASQVPLEELFYKGELYKLNKKVLRDLARKVGFGVAPMFAKKAIQFGTKVAQQYNKMIFESHRKAKGWKNYNKK